MSATTAPALVTAAGLIKRYDDLTAVNEVSFTIAPGEVVGFLGPNGAGKTTIIRMLTCTSPLSAGRLQVFGLDVLTAPRQIKAQIGVVPQDNNYDPELTVIANLTTYGRYFQLDAQIVAQRARELLAFVQLTEKLNAPVEELSGGMKRRLILARSLINQPRLLVLDEPTTGLDPQARRLIWQRIRELRHRGVTIIITTHYMDEAEQVCDRLLVMDNGKIIAEGSPRELIDRYVGAEVLEIVPELNGTADERQWTPSESESESPELKEVLKTCPNYQRLGDKYEIFTNECPNVLEAIRSRVKLASFSVRRATLEDVFIKLTGRELRD